MPEEWLPACAGPEGVARQLAALSQSETDHAEAQRALLAMSFADSPTIVKVLSHTHTHTLDNCEAWPVLEEPRSPSCGALCGARLHTMRASLLFRSVNLAWRMWVICQGLQASTDLSYNAYIVWRLPARSVQAYIHNADQCLSRELWTWQWRGGHLALPPSQCWQACWPMRAGACRAPKLHGRGGGSPGGMQ